MSPLARQGVLRAEARQRLASEGPLPPAVLARTVLGFGRIEAGLADRLLGTLLGDDPRFELDAGRWRLARSDHPPATRPLDRIPFVVVDVETTGGRPPADRVTEIGAVRLVGGRVEGEWASLVNPGRSIPWFVTRLTGIDDGMVAAAPGFGRVAQEFLAFLGDAAFVAHNAQFDWRFVNAELLRASGGVLSNARLCTVRLARRLLPHVRRRNLDALAWLFGITVEGRHRALGDARATARILARLLDVALEQGIETEADLAELCGLDGTLAPAEA